MSLTPYSPCPCGSGKSFKWCCLPFWPQVEKARGFAAQGQMDAAMRTITEIVERHPGNVSALGYKAEMLQVMGKMEESDEVLQQAFSVNPDFTFGH